MSRRQCRPLAACGSRNTSSLGAIRTTSPYFFRTSSIIHGYLRVRLAESLLSAQVFCAHVAPDLTIVGPIIYTWRRPTKDQSWQRALGPDTSKADGNRHCRLFFPPSRQWPKHTRRALDTSMSVRNTHGNRVELTHVAIVTNSWPQMWPDNGNVTAIRDVGRFSASKNKVVSGWCVRGQPK